LSDLYQSCCPHCGAVFRVDAAQLGEDRSARCGICFELFAAVPKSAEAVAAESSSFEETLFLVDPFGGEVESGGFSVVLESKAQEEVEPTPDSEIDAGLELTPEPPLIADLESEPTETSPAFKPNDFSVPSGSETPSEAELQPDSEVEDGPLLMPEPPPILADRGSQLEPGGEVGKGPRGALLRRVLWWLLLLLLVVAGVVVTPWGGAWLATLPLPLSLMTALAGLGVSALLLLTLVWSLRRNRIAEKPTAPAVEQLSEEPERENSAAAPASPLFDTDLRGHRSLRSWGLRVGVVSMGLVIAAGLVAGYGYFFRADLATVTAVRPYLERLCAVTGCDLPPLRDPAQFTLRQVYVGGHPQRSGYLLVQGRLVNRGGFRQPYPDLQLQFFDRHEQMQANFYFKPTEYLGVRTDPALGLAPGASVPMTLEIADPGSDAVNYNFTFR